MMQPFDSRAHAVWFRFCAVCLAVYMAYAAWLSNSFFLMETSKTIIALGVFAALAALLYGVFMQLGRKKAFFALPLHPREKNDLRVFLSAFGIALAIFGCAFAACYPGGVNYDISNQWRQAHSGEFNNWHPLFHTILIWLAVQAADSYPVVLLMQIVVFAAAMAWLAAVVHRAGIPAWLVLVVHALTAASPPVRNALMYVGKDSAMTIGVMLLTAQTIRMLFSRGEWLRKPVNAVCFGALLALTTLLRHNAMMWTWVLLAAVFFCWKKMRGQTALAAGVMAVILALVQGPLYGALDVVYPDNLTDESLGIPMTVLGDVKQLDPDALDEETHAFLNTLASDEEWQQTYRLHNYNSIKFTFDREYVARRAPGEILSMAARAAAAAPRTAFEAVNGLTDLVWGLSGENEAAPSVRNSGHIPEAAYGSAKLNALGGRLLGMLDAVMNLPPIRYVQQNIGVMFLLFLLTTLWTLRCSGVCALVPALPALAYNLGTMLLLASNDARFFQYFMTTAPFYMLALIYLPKENEHAGNA